jgi:glycosyltransferase involved in cell wall biosynthesis
MRIGIYNPYLHTLGGGERYCFDIASCFASRGDRVDVFWDDATIIERARARFGINTQKIHVVSNVWQHGSWKQKLITSRLYDVLFWMSDGSIPTSLAGKTYIIFQFPFPEYAPTFLTRMKVQRYAGVICYSSFVKEYVDRLFGVEARVIAPAIDTAIFTAGKKERLIVSVGRFTQGKNTKKQEYLISAFKKLSNATAKSWKLVLAGGMLETERPFVETLKKQSQGYPIFIVPNISLQELKSLYAHASMYWHAAGAGEDIHKHPDRAEHFGMTTLEAMSAGAVPVVFAGGGQKEIIVSGVHGFLWVSEQELVQLTQKLIDDVPLRKQLAAAAAVHARAYSKETFCANVMALV